jgi:hypothetical protein
VACLFYHSHVFDKCCRPNARGPLTAKKILV